MIEIKNKNDCCGCTACASACPKQCITMKKDNEGFQYPFVDKEKCIDCHICEKKCPIVGKEKVVASLEGDKYEVNRKAIETAKYLPETYVCFLKDNRIREQSTSGGIFTALAQYVLEQNGTVCGVILDENQNVVHAFAENEIDIEKMRRSKYVQSDQVGVYKKVKEELCQGRIVLYTGTPCQVAGLKSYLGKEYEKLLTVDVFCHGVGSPLYWEKYVQYISRKMKSKIKEVRFREKTYGYNSACLAVYFENGKSIHKGHDDDLYWSAFSKNYIYRPSCYACVFKSINHVSDFSIGDFWDTSNLSEVYKSANGCSIVLSHTDKAKKVLEQIENLIDKQPVRIDEALNINGGHQPSMLITCPSVPERRESWFDDIVDMTPKELVNKYIPLGIKGKIKSVLKPIFYKVGLLEKMKSIR
ncbi:MAG: Coenzyme F420 hydrogenase/dehydrogenase, beta subunit C-terminal domain [Oliverpabstia sp.]|nr:Coenzyme F420 hydrogenase/dehydrogenase, beta subunit C-terminal domain [Oliverpabstia sp.]